MSAVIPTSALPTNYCIGGANAVEMSSCIDVKISSMYGEEDGTSIAAPGEAKPTMVRLEGWERAEWWLRVGGCYVPVR